jgi:hypothetical protein
MHFLYTHASNLKWQFNSKLQGSREVWRYPSGNQKPQIEEGQTMQRPEVKGHKNKQWYTTETLAPTLYQVNHDRKHKLCYIGSTKRYILHLLVLLECCYIKMESSQWENWNHLLCRNFFFTESHYQSWGEGQGIKQALLYLWYPLFQALP